MLEAWLTLLKKHKSSIHTSYYNYTGVKWHVLHVKNQAIKLIQGISLYTSREKCRMNNAKNTVSAKF